MAYRDKFIMDDALPIRNLTIATIGMAEQLRAAISFSQPDMPSLWRDFMAMFAMLYGITKWFLYDKKAKGELDAFMESWFKYGATVTWYHSLNEKVAQKLMSAEDAAPALAEARMLFTTVNPMTSLQMLDVLVEELKKKGIFSIKESTTVEEGIDEEVPQDETPSLEGAADG